FFFSSRRRRTRWPRDWSSDVCSSDLFFSIASLTTPLVAGSALVLGAMLRTLGKRRLSVLARPILILAVAQAVYAVIQQLVVGREIGRESCRGSGWLMRVMCVAEITRV